MAMASGSPPTGLEVLGEVEGVSCNATGHDPKHPRGKVVSEFEALYDLKLAAAGLEAERVVEARCARREPT